MNGGETAPQLFGAKAGLASAQFRSDALQLGAGSFIKGIQ
jgi:hypothetical protein